MPDYQKMYYTLFHEVDNTIERLQKALQNAEEIYVRTAPSEENEDEA